MWEYRCKFCRSVRLLCLNIDVPLDQRWYRCLSCHKDNKHSEVSA